MGWGEKSLLGLWLLQEVSRGKEDQLRIHFTESVGPLITGYKKGGGKEESRMESRPGAYTVGRGNMAPSYFQDRVNWEGAKFRW